MPCGGHILETPEFLICDASNYEANMVANTESNCIMLCPQHHEGDWYWHMQVSDMLWDRYYWVLLWGDVGSKWTNPPRIVLAQAKKLEWTLHGAKTLNSWQHDLSEPLTNSLVIVSPHMGAHASLCKSSEVYFHMLWHFLIATYLTSVLMEAHAAW